MLVANSICIIGSGLLVGLPDSRKWSRLVALWLCYFQGLWFSTSLTMVSSNVAGYTKKVYRGAAVYWVLRGEYHWAADVQGERCVGVSERLYCVSNTLFMRLTDADLVGCWWGIWSSWRGLRRCMCICTWRIAKGWDECGVG
jgi:hypothetical protein